LIDICFENSLDKLIGAVDALMMEGHSAEQTILQLYDEILMEPRINEIKKARIFEKIAFCEKSLNEGAREDLQLNNLFASCMSIINRADFDKAH
jgi:DNA polymerase III delta prime subunit